MVRYLFCLILFVISTWIIPDHVYPQQNSAQSLYLKVDYFKAEGSDISEYLDVELNLWKELHQERYNRGIIKSWDFYQVVAGAVDSDYNYVAINVFDDFSMIDYFDLESIIQSVYPEMDPDELMERTRNSREVIRTEIWEVNGRLMKSGLDSPGGDYMTFNYFDARDSSGEHMALEFDFWGPVHETRLDLNILNSWAMYTLLYPSGDAKKYTYATIDAYDNLADLIEPIDVSLAKAAHPQLTDEELDDYLITRTSEARTLYKSELWKRIGFVGSAK